jgi:signal peptidase II
MTRSRAIFLFLALLSIDQISKYIIRHHSGFYICNANISFGLKMPVSIFFLTWLFIFTILTVSLLKKNPANTTFLLLILSGAISNMLDRIAVGCIIDFIDLKFWPVFNLADMFITTGVIMLIYKNIVKPKKGYKS